MEQQLNINGKVFTSWKYDDATWFITAMSGSQYLYLLEGENYSLLIDTAYGFGDLRNYVESLTSKPVMVALTHGHLDHSGGAAEWEEVYMHNNAPIDMSGNENSNLPYPDYKRIFIGDGYIFDLGGRKVEVFDISSHSNGSLAFLDASHGLLFTGDEIESMQVLMFNLGGAAGYDFEARIKKHKGNMLKLKERSGEYNYICPAHNGAPISKSYIDDFIDLDDHILDGDAIIEEKLNHIYIDGTPMANGLCRVKWNKASFFSSRVDVDKFRR